MRNSLQTGMYNNLISVLLVSITINIGFQLSVQLGKEGPPGEEKYLIDDEGRIWPVEDGLTTSPHASPRIFSINRPVKIKAIQPADVAKKVRAAGNKCYELKDGSYLCVQE
ncbi:hypothetical protein [Chitinophaga sp. CB10]|uniref:hypothetical protein n=1 Tax=Chitinophaga sp. CB10 TaxID=1891659 RepID=UPI0025C5D587|nr:hypothetical protein [Chitinophaga sp. CB10]